MAMLTEGEGRLGEQHRHELAVKLLVKERKFHVGFR